jgi:hypothetical protein
MPDQHIGVQTPGGNHCKINNLRIIQTLPKVPLQAALSPLKVQTGTPRMAQFAAQVNHLGNALSPKIWFKIRRCERAPATLRDDHIGRLLIQFAYQVTPAFG